MTDSSEFDLKHLAQAARSALEGLEAGDLRVVRRGYERHAVESRMREASRQMRRLLDATESLIRRLADLESVRPSDLEAKRITAALGSEAVHLLESARSAAQKRVERAEAQCAHMLDQAREAAAEVIQDARAQGREVVAEARNVRKRMLDDVARRRHGHRTEVAQLRAVRDRMLAALADCQQGLDELLSDLVEATPAAVAAAKRVGLQIASEPEPTARHIEAEIEAARYAGLPVAPEAEPGALRGLARGGASPARLYDVEAEADKPAERVQASAEPEPASDKPEEAGRADDADMPADEPAEPGGAEPELPDQPEPADKTEPAAETGVESVFARLRSANRSQPPSEPGPAGDRSDPHTSDDASSDSAADDGLAAARSLAVIDLTRELKRLIMHEQGELLDAIRRNGRAALAARAARGHAEALRRPLENFAFDVEASADHLDLAAAAEAISSALESPVQARLRALDCPDDDLSSAVRAIYREFRTERAPAAAQAALDAALKGFGALRDSTAASR